MDPINKNDDQFNTQLNALKNWLANPINAGKAGISSPEVNTLLNGTTNWNTTFAAKKAHDTAALPITEGKNTARDMVEPTMRAIYKIMRARVGLGSITTAEALAAGLAPVDSIATPAGQPTTHPVFTATPDQRLQHRLTWTDETTPGTKAKPAGVKEVEIRVAVVAQGQPAPADPDDYNYYTTRDASSPNIVEYEPADAGKLAWIIGCWMNSKGERGPCSAAISETIRG